MRGCTASISSAVLSSVRWIPAHPTPIPACVQSSGTPKGNPNAFVSELWSLRGQRMVALNARGPACFDTAYYTQVGWLPAEGWVCQFPALACAMLAARADPPASLLCPPLRAAQPRPREPGWVAAAALGALHAGGAVPLLQAQPRRAAGWRGRG